MIDPAGEPRTTTAIGAAADGVGSDPYSARPWRTHYADRIPPEVEIPDLTVDGLLRLARSRYAARPALTFFGAKTSYRQLDEAADRFANALSTLGMEKGDRISLHLPTSPAFVIAFLGALRAGCVVVPMNPLYVERELEAVLRDTAPRLSVCLDVLVPRIRGVRAKLERELGPAPGGVAVISTGVQDSMPVPIRWLYPIKARREGRWHPVPHTAETPNLFRLIREVSAEPHPSAAQPGDPALLQPTGGTTGVPKAAILTHRNLVANAVQLEPCAPRPSADGDAVLCALPYFHIYGLTVAMTLTLLLGGNQVLLPRWDAKMALEAIAKHRPRSFPGAPVMYASMTSHPDLSKYDIRSVEQCISGSAPLPEAVQNAFERASGGTVYEGYGLTEASPVTHTNSVARDRRPGTIGLPISSTEARIVALGDNRPVPLGEVGELWVRGPQVMAGYWNRPDETARVLHDGWLATGDMATMDADGYFRIVDRRKDLIINGGINVYPREVEEVLLLHPAVQDAVVVAQPDSVRGELPAAYVVLKPGATATDAELFDHCRANLARYKVPCAIEFRTELPRSTIGKVLRRVLAEERRAAVEDERA